MKNLSGGMGRLSREVTSDRRWDDKHLQVVCNMAMKARSINANPLDDLKQQKSTFLRSHIF